MRSAPVRLTDGGPLEFNVDAVQDQYTDLSSSYLDIECSVVRTDGGGLGATADDVKAWPGDNMLHSIFKRVTFAVSGQDVEYVPNYPYRSYIETLLSHGVDAKKGRLAGLSGWFEDGNLGRDHDQLTDAATAARKGEVFTDKTLSFCGELHLASLSQDRYLPPGVSCKLEMERSESAFCLMSTAAAPENGARVKLTKCDLYVRRLHVNPTLQNAHTESMLRGDLFNYQLTRVKTQLLTLPMGVQQHTLKVDESGQLPQRLFVGFVRHTAQSGHFQQNPFNFQAFGVNSVSLIFNGIPVGQPFRPSFARNSWAREYKHLMDTSDKGGGESDNGLTYERFGQGFALYAFDGRPNLSQGDAVPLIRTGTVNVDVSFAEPTTQTLSAVIYAEHYGAFTLDAEQNVAIVGAPVL